MDEEIALSASRLLRKVLQRSCLQIRLQSTLVKNTTVLTIYLLLVFVLGKTSKPDDWQERLKGTRLWGSFELKDFKFEATLSMMLFLHPPVEEEFRLSYKVGCTSDSQRQHSLLGHMDEEEIALSASRLLRGVLQRSCLQIRLQSTLVKNTTYYLLTTCLCAGQHFKT